jgi:hypothetical protein
MQQKRAGMARLSCTLTTEGLNRRLMSNACSTLPGWKHGTALDVIMP